MTLPLAILAVVVVAAAVYVVLQKRKTPPPRSDAPPYVASNSDPHLAALDWAARHAPGGAVAQVGVTGSMRPLLEGGEWAVLANDYDGIMVGSVVAYTTVGGSAPALGSRLIHRISRRDESGWIPMGDSALSPLEYWNPITRSNYLGTLVAIFRQA